MVVLTAAHNIYNFETKENAKDIIFIPGKNGSKADFGEFKVLRVFFPRQYIDNLENENNIKKRKKQIEKDKEKKRKIKKGKKEEEFKLEIEKELEIEEEELEIEDYAILFLEKGENKSFPGFETGYVGVKSIENINQVKDDILSIYGYPGVGKNLKVGKMWGMEVKIDNKTVNIKNDHINYQIYTSKGQSGSGLIVKNKNIHKVIGVHICKLFDNDKFVSNSGPLITKERFANIQNCMKKTILENEKEYEEIIKKFLETENNKGRLNLSSNDKVKSKSDEKYLQKLKYLENLDLKLNKIGTLEIEFLSKLNLPNLKKLNLSSNNLGRLEIEYLAKLNLTNLTHLDLSSNNLEKKGIKELSNLNLPNLKELNLSSNNMEKEGMKNFSKLKLNKLEKLNLNNNKIRNDGLKILVKMNLENLKQLNLCNNNIKKKGFNFLFDLKNLDQMKKIELNRNKLGKIEKDIFKEIKRKFPKISIS